MCAFTQYFLHAHQGTADAQDRCMSWGLRGKSLSMFTGDPRAPMGGVKGLQVAAGVVWDAPSPITGQSEHQHRAPQASAGGMLGTPSI
jgi:hypothetical protein